MTNIEFHHRLVRIKSEIDLAEHFNVKIGHEPNGRFYYQIECWRRDVISQEMGFGYGGKAYLSEHATDSELVQTIFGLYKAYWEHEARESFQWRGRRVFGPHISTGALWEVARRVDVRSQRHVEDKPDDHGVPGGVTYTNDAMDDYDLNSRA